LTLVARMEHTRLGVAVTAERGIPAERLGTQAGQALHRELSGGTTLDVHAADQLLIYMALAGGTSAFRVCSLSSHARTTLWLLKRLMPLDYRETQQGELVGVELHSTCCGHA
jgi:RNA 3'-terminal phosphate cyclase (ATP)/RNA 3'-terminal phosphate cyclase (GTP)